MVRAAGRGLVRAGGVLVFALAAQGLPLQLELCRGLFFASSPIVKMWGRGDGGSGVGTKSTMIKREDIQQLNGRVG
jgi:hypothetical protein